MSLVRPRARRRDDRAGDPLDGLVNLFDLGVVLAQSVITQHGGTLAYVSTVGKGTIATIVLPSQAVTTPEPTPRAAMIEARA